MSDQPSTAEDAGANLFGADEAAGWVRLRAGFSEDAWGATYDLLWQAAPRITERGAAVEFLFDAYGRLEDDFARASALLLLARVSVFLHEEERTEVYQRLVDLEREANPFLRSKLLQLSGLFAHILDNSMLVAGQLAARRPETNPFCAMAHTRALRRAYLVRPDPAIGKAIERYQQAADSRVKAEAYVQAASIHLIRSVAAKDRSELGALLDEMVASLDAARVLEPERPDVTRLAAVADACRALTAVPIDRTTVAVVGSQLRALWRQSLADDDGGEGAVESEWLVVEAVERVASILEQVDSLPRALDASAGLVAIAEAAVFLEALGDLGFGSGSPSELAVSLLVRQGYQHYVDVNVKRSLWAGLQHAKAKVQTLLTGNIGATSPDTAAYLTGVLDVFADIEKGTTSRFDPGLLITLARAMPARTPAEIEQALVEHQNRGSLDRFLLDALASATTEAGLPQVREFLGGFPKGQRILRRIRDELAPRLVGESPEALANFMNVVTYVMRYMFAASERKLPVKYLMSKLAGGKGEDAVEADLEEALHLFLLNSDIAFAVRRQPNAATGRVDLALHFGDIFFPIEVKREKSDLSRGHLRDEYLAQASSYTRAYDRLGIFLVLDLTTKVKGEPLPDLENLVWVEEMVPRPGASTLQVGIPDFVVTCVIPGNQPRPSDLSSYS